MSSTYQTLANVYTDVRFIAGKDSTTLLDADLLRMANKYYLWLVRELVDIGEMLYGQISTADLVQDQREYPLPVDEDDGETTHPYGGGAINIIRVEISYDAGANWYVASPTNLMDFDRTITLDAKLNDYGSTTSPLYWFFDRSVFITPVPSSSDSVSSGNAGIRIWYIQRPGEMEDSAEIPDLPKDFLNILAEGMLIDVFRKYGRNTDMRIAQERFDSLTDRMRSMEQEVDYGDLPRLGVTKKRYR